MNTFMKVSCAARAAGREKKASKEIKIKSKW